MRKVSAYKLPEEKCTCLECGDPLSLTQGRSDRKFCSEKCRNKYHNRVNRSSRSVVQSVINKLMKNYNILQDLWEKGYPAMDLATLEARGFKSELVTSSRKENSRYIYTCFDFEYRKGEKMISGLRRLPRK